MKVGTVDLLHLADRKTWCLFTKLLKILKIDEIALE